MTTPGFSCEVDHEFVDRHAREFAICSVGGKDVAATLVSEGLAFAYGRRTSYVGIEEEAKAERRGPGRARSCGRSFFGPALRIDD